MKKWILKKLFNVKKHLRIEWGQIEKAEVKETLNFLGIAIYSRYRIATKKEVEQYLGI